MAIKKLVFCTNWSLKCKVGQIKVIFNNTLQHKSSITKWLDIWSELIPFIIGVVGFMNEKLYLAK